MSLIGYNDQSKLMSIYAEGFNMAAAAAGSGQTASQGTVKANSLIAYDATTKSQVNDWITTLKTTSSQKGAPTTTTYTLVHLISWQSN